MKKLVIVISLTMIALLLVSGLAAVKAEKVEVCHIVEANDVVVGFWGVVDLYFGKVISVSAKAVDAHIAHGDSTTFFTNQQAIEDFAAAGVKLPAANCYISVPTGG